MRNYLEFRSICITFATRMGLRGQASAGCVITESPDKKLFYEDKK